MKETDIAEPVMKWLESMRWDCYPEAQFRRGSGRADIAAKRDGVLMIVECKVTFSLALLSQATEWMRRAHYVAIAVPKRAGRWFAGLEYCRIKGIGIYRVSGSSVYEDMAPSLNRSAHYSAKALISDLHPDMKRYRPGGQSADGFSTPFRRTMDAVKEFITNNPGCTIKEITTGVPHHYHSSATARACIPKWLDTLEKDVRIERSGKISRFYIA